MPTWKKVVVSGSAAHLSSVTASVAVLVGSNQVITTSPTTTTLTGSFSGSFIGNGSGITGVTATFPTTATTNLATTDQIYVNDGANKFITYANFVTDLAGSGAGTSNLTTADAGDSLALTSQIAVTGVTASFTGSLTGALIGTASWATNATNAVSSSVLDTQTGTGPYYISFVAGTSGNQAQLIDSTGLTYNATTNVITATASLASAVANNLTQGSGITTFTYNGSSAQTVSLRNNGALSNNTVLKWDSGNGQLTNTIITDDGSTVTIGGNLNVTGTTVTVNTENLTVSDKFILLASGSTTNVDSGIIVSNAANNTGSAFYYDGTDQRWAVAPTAASSTTSVTANSYVVTVSGSSVDPASNPLYGAANGSRIGAMYVNTTDESIWIWS